MPGYLREVTVEFRDRSYRMVAFEGDHITQVMSRSHAFYEQDLLSAIRDLGRGGLYVDVGAFIGTHSVFFAGECSADLVVAIEPAYESFQVLSKNAEIMHERGAHWRGVPILCMRSAVHHVWSSARTSRVADHNRGMTLTLEGGSVPVIKIDDIETTMGQVDLPVGLIKADVEGCELAVLRSGARTIERWRPAIVAEAHDQGRRDEITDYLKPFGYAPSRKYARTPTYIWTSR